MKNTTIGFIGAGNMASAIIGGMVKANLIQGSQIIAADPDQKKLSQLNKDYNIQSGDNKTTAATADILFLSVKPNMFPIVINEIKDSVKPETVIVSIAAGQTLENIEKLFAKQIKLIRIMPNTPAFVGEAMSAVCANGNVSQDSLDKVLTICNSFGKAAVVPESMFHAVVGVSGSSPAYAFMFIEALADAAVLKGMPRTVAYEFAAQALLGSAKMVLETGKHPGELKDMVCSPGGTTIEAVAVLEQMGFRNAVIDATVACAEKSKEMSR
jgi:pyrroline-5-carboxylate reductase